MESRIVGLFLVALIGGLVGSLGLTHIIYQPQIDSLKNMMWHEECSITASENVTSGDFELKGSLVRVMWITESYELSAWVSFELYFSNGTGYGVWQSSRLGTANNAVLGLDEPGSYYLNATSYLTHYDVSVWDYY